MADDPEAELRKKRLAAYDFADEVSHEYWTREEARHRVPAGVDFEEAWTSVQRQRDSAPYLLLHDQSKEFFRLQQNSKIQELLHKIDSLGMDSMFKDVENSLRMQLIGEALLEESLFSSRIEGLVTTYAAAEKLAREERLPKNKAERGVLNNYHAMQWILANRTRPIDESVVLELHRVVCSDALEFRPEFAGRFRDGPVSVVSNATGEPVYQAPTAAEIDFYLWTLFQWLARDSGPNYRHPVVRASVLHFYFVYVHPFYDGNGRTARALFYHSLLRAGYDSFRYLSISAAIFRRRAQYYAAIRRSEDERDLTPFVIFSCEVVSEAIDGVRAKLAGEYGVKRLEQRLAERSILVNDRQAKLLRRCMQNPGRRFSIDDYAYDSDVVYETARKDVTDLEAKGLIYVIGKKKKQAVYALKETFFV